MEYVVVTIKGYDEFIDTMTDNRASAVKCAADMWDSMTEYDRKHSNIEVRRYPDEDSDDYDVIWRRLS